MSWEQKAKRRRYSVAPFNCAIGAHALPYQAMPYQAMGRVNSE